MLVLASFVYVSLVIPNIMSVFESRAMFIPSLYVCQTLRGSQHRYQWAVGWFKSVLLKLSDQGPIFEWENVID